jgi:hypothetical protein
MNTRGSGCTKPTERKSSDRSGLRSTMAMGVAGLAPGCRIIVATTGHP